MKKPPVQGWTPAKVKYPVQIPTLDGKAVARTIEIEVDAWRDAEGEVFLDGEAREKIEAVKARHMGLLSPAELKELRESLGATQKELSELLQLGEKTWTRWESGRERPSRSMNVLLCALRDGKVDLGYLEGLRLGYSLAVLWRDEPAAQSNRPLQYRTVEGKQELRSILQMFEEVCSKRADRDDLIAFARSGVPGAQSKVSMQSSFLSNLSRSAEVGHSQEMPWCTSRILTHRSRGVSIRVGEGADDVVLSA